MYFHRLHQGDPAIDIPLVVAERSARRVLTTHLKTGASPLHLKCNMGAGHGGASGRYDRLQEVSFEYAWLMSQVGITR